MDAGYQQTGPLQTIVETIVEMAHPERVVLFGSRARGTEEPGSDYDFLVVVRGVRNERDISRRIYRALLAKKVDAAVDLVVVGAKTLQRQKDNPFYVYRRALLEGQVCYDRRGV
ncbi:MAG: nucleotidyltransferase domain-containing protein [Anaerolineae bacterium]